MARKRASFLIVSPIGLDQAPFRTPPLCLLTTCFAACMYN
jgi:hypothetical protein